MTNVATSGSAPDSVMRLIRSLTKGTTDGTVKWSKTGPFNYRFEGGLGAVALDTVADDQAPFVFTIFDGAGQELEAYEGPTRFSEASLDAALSALWRAIWARERAQTVDPIISSLIDAAGGEAPSEEPSPGFNFTSDLDDLPF